MTIISKNKHISIEQATKKIESYCAYQERSHFEVKQKLYSYGLYSTQVNQIIANLINANFLNEERYALAIASGKFNIKGWGKKKIKNYLKLKNVSEYNIKSALKSINEEEYLNKLEIIATKKNKSIKETNPYRKKQKLILYLIGKGYEQGFISKIAEKLIEI